jgi:tellurium resistance protein TerD
VGVNLQKGGNVSLTKLAEAAGTTLRHAVIACGWDVNQSLFGSNFDLDLSAVGLDASGKVPHQQDPTDGDYQEWFIFANHRHDSRRAIVFMGDNRTGSGKGDDELIKVDLANVPDSITRIVFQVVIWRAKERRQKFGKVKNAFIRIFDEATGEEFTRYNLGAEFSNETLVIFGELYRHNGEWKFRAIGQGYDAAAFRAQHGIERPFETEYARYSN